MIAMTLIDRIGRKTLLLIGAVALPRRWPEMAAIILHRHTIRICWSGAWWASSHLRVFPQAR